MTSSMKNFGYGLLIAVLSISVFRCASIKELSSESKVAGRIVQMGLFNGISPEAKDEEGEPVFCESSAVTKMGDQLVVANDKTNPVKGESSVFSISSKNKNWNNIIDQPQYIFSDLLKKANKIEAFAYSPQTDLHFFCTAFDRVKSDNSWDNYNILGYWEGNDIENARILYRTENDGMVSSKNLREILHRAIRDRKYPNGVSYYKLEGLAVLPDNTLLFGVREMGPSYQDFDYKFMILSTSFIKSRDGVVINPDFRKVYEYDPQKHPSIDQPLGLSSMEYHPESNSLAILTSYEKEGESFQTYLWMLPIQRRLSNRTQPILVTDQEENPLMFPFKGEGLTFLDKNTLFVVFDEDRTLSEVETEQGILKRAPHQGLYAIVDLKSK